MSDLPDHEKVCVPDVKLKFKPPPGVKPPRYVCLNICKCFTIYKKNCLQTMACPILNIQIIFINKG
jgi:hypothetical protein